MRSGCQVAENVAQAVAFIKEAAAQGATFVVTPEMTSLLTLCQETASTSIRSEGRDEALPVFRKLAHELDLWLQIGSLPIKLESGVCANRSYLIANTGEIAARYDKIHMFDAHIDADNVYRESKRYRAGTTAVVATLPHAKLGMSICYDVRFPHLYRALAKQGAQIISIPAAFIAATGAAHWHILTRARAIETGCFVLAPGQGGRHEDGRETYGHSLILSPWGDILAEAGIDPTVIYADLDLDQVRLTRQKLASLEHDRDFVVEHL
jgi:predicted amidohydrolase